jgi:16S rRNA (uracil1498-N3)-methyltransferase
LFVFYSTDIDTDKGSLQEEDLHHCVHVLRYKEGDLITVTNGNGLIVSAKISKITKSILYFEVLSFISELPDPIQNAIALSPPKSSDRLEWFVEKATEIGIKQIILFESSRTERSRINVARLQKIAISAMKQSKQSYLPTIVHYEKIATLFQQCTDFQTKLIAFCEMRQSYIQKHIAAGNHIVMIGPEGDFTNEEVDMAKSHGFSPVSLGKTILRTETAGLFAATLLENYKNL